MSAYTDPKRSPFKEFSDAKGTFRFEIGILKLLSFIVIGVFSRTIGSIAPNFELVTGLSLVSATALPRKIAWLVPISIMGITDLIIGNSSIFIFTWSAFLITYFLGARFKNNINNSQLGSKLMKTSGLGIVSVFIFFLWTNLGVVITSNLYPLTVVGYLQSLIMALPFLKMQLVAAVITVPMIQLIYEMLTSKTLLTKLNLQHSK